MTQISSCKFSLARLAAVALMSLGPLVCRAQSFSADVVYLTGVAKPGASPAAATSTPHGPSKLYVSKDRMRLETRGTSGTILLVNGGEGTAFAVFPAQKAYQPLVGGPSEYLRVGNPDDACADWQRVMTQKVACEKSGVEEVAGRSTVKYVGKNAAGTAVAAVWIDSALRFAIKWQSAGASAELRDIKVAEQADDLFTVPSGYGLMTPLKAKSKGFVQKSR